MFFPLMTTYLLRYQLNFSASVCNGWIDKLNNTGIYTEAVTFEDNPEYYTCRGSTDHASNLEPIVEDFKSLIHADKINLVVHSKGGLDANFLANNLANEDVANLCSADPVGQIFNFLRHTIIIINIIVIRICLHRKFDKLLSVLNTIKY